MPRLAIAHWSGSGSVTLAAQLIADGSRAEGVEADLIDVSKIGDAGWETLAQADAIIFGTPTYMGGPAAGFKAFMDATGSAIFVKRQWLDKLAGGFTSGSTYFGTSPGARVPPGIWAMSGRGPSRHGR